MLDYLTSEPKKFLFDGCKLLWHQERLQQFLNGERIMPIHIDMGIHKACNIKCVYCYGVKQGKGTQFISKSALRRLARDAGLVGVKSVSIIGDGEPTMNEGLLDFTFDLHAFGVDCAVATNGLLLHGNLGKVDSLTSSCTWLRFNISGIDKYDSIMGAPAGSLAKIEAVVKHAVAHNNGCTIGLQAVLIPDGFSEILPLAKAAVDWGVDYLVIKQFSDGGAGMPMHFDMDEYGKAQDDLLQAATMSNERTKIIVKWGAMKDSTEITKRRHWGFDRCIDLPFLFQISGDGGCYPCGFMFGNAEYCYGNVNEQELCGILYSDHYWNIVRKVAATPLDKLCTGQCRHCECLKFMDILTKEYHGDLDEALVKMCGGPGNYGRLMANPPVHLNFV